MRDPAFSAWLWLAFWVGAPIAAGLIIGLLL